MNKMLETVGAVHTHTHTTHFLTKENEKTCNSFDAGSYFDTQILIDDGLIFRLG